MYFLHHILHSWPDEKCVQILTHLKNAMEPGYSKILINELILSDQGASTFESRSDMLMMSLTWGMERSRRQWETLLDKAGLEVVRFMAPESDIDGIIEVIRR